MPYLGTKPLDSVTVKDIDGQRFILDADADTSFHADTDDQIDIEIAGADDFQFTANTFTALSGSTIAAQALTATTGTFTSTVSSNGFNPDAADGAALGSASLEFSDLYLADSSVIYFGNDQDVRLIHNADAGLKLKMTNTSGNSGIGAQLILQTGDTDMAAGNSHGQIIFQAPDEGTGTDAILAAAKISADAEGDFSSSSNATSLNFYCSVSEDVGGNTERVSIGSAGAFVTKPLAGGHAVFNEGSVDADFRIESNANTHMFFVDGGNNNILIDESAGLTTADGTVHIHKATAGSVTANTTWDELVIENNTHTGISILTPASATGGIIFGDPDDNDIGSIQYDHATDKLTFVIAASTEMQMTTAAIFPNSVDGLSLGLASNEWADLYLADGGVIYFGNDQDVSLTHVADTGLLLSSTDQLQFGDSGTYIHQSADGVLDLVSDTEIEINATTIDINGNVEISGDLTVSGDDITMGTNTSGAVLVADGTNFNPVVVSGDATIATNGALTIAANAVEGSMLNNNTISGLTALTSGLATTDELMVSDGGTLKRMDASVLTVLTDGTATALAIALG